MNHNKNELFLVTGAAGNLGLKIVKDLLAKNKKVRALVLPFEESIIKNIPKIEYVIGDITKIESLKPLFRQLPSQELIVIHCASKISIASKTNKSLQDINVNGTKNMLELAIKNHVKRFIYISSVHALEELPYPQVASEVDHFNLQNLHGGYAHTKAEASQLVLDAFKQNNLNAIILMPSGIIGPDQNLTGNMFNMLLNFLKGRLKIAVAGGFDFVDIRDVTSAIIKAIEIGDAGETFILSNRYYTFKEILDMLAEIANLPKTKIFLSKPVAKIFAILVEFFEQFTKNVPVITSYAIYTAFQNSLYSHEKATNLLGFNPRPLKDTLTDLVIDLKNRKIIK